MSMPAIFFVASESVAQGVHLNHTLPPEDVAELSGVDTLKMSTLWAIIDGKPWDVELMDEFQEIYTTDSEWLYRIPDDLTKKLAVLDDSRIEQVASAWAKTDEMLCKPAEAVELFNIIAEIAKRSIQTSRSFYLYVSL
jgi:hypothetical protein